MLKLVAIILFIGNVAASAQTLNEGYCYTQKSRSLERCLGGSNSSCGDDAQAAYEGCMRAVSAGASTTDSDAVDRQACRGLHGRYTIHGRPVMCP